MKKFLSILFCLSALISFSCVTYDVVEIENPNYKLILNRGESYIFKETDTIDYLISAERDENFYFIRSSISIHNKTENDITFYEENIKAFYSKSLDGEWIELKYKTSKDMEKKLNAYAMLYAISNASTQTSYITQTSPNTYRVNTYNNSNEYFINTLKSIRGKLLYSSTILPHKEYGGCFYIEHSKENGSISDLRGYYIKICIKINNQNEDFYFYVCEA